MINPASIGSQSSLNAGGSRRTQDLVQKLLNSFTIQSRVKIQGGEEHRFIEKVRENCGPSDSVKTDRWPRSHDDCGPRSQDPTIIAHPIFIGRSGYIHVWPTIAEITINLMRPMFHLRDRRLHLMHVLLMTIRWTPVHTIDALHLMRLRPTPVKRPRVPWALHLPAPSRCHVAPPERLRGLAWSCHVSTSPQRAGQRGAATWPACHVASAWVPRATSA